MDRTVTLDPERGVSTQAFDHRHPSRLLRTGSEAVAQPRLAMRTIKEILRLHLVGGVSSRRQLARAVGCGKTAISECLRRAAAAGLTDWEAIAELDET
jgi:hypothetical protein